MHLRIIPNLLCVFLFLRTEEIPACTPDTVIFTGDRVIPIQRVCINMPLVSLSTQWRLIACKIRHIECPQKKEQLIKIVFANGESVTVAHSQQFLLFDTHTWIPASHLTAGSRLVRIGDEPCIVEETIRVGLGKVWHIDVGEPHIFFISRYCVATP